MASCYNGGLRHSSYPGASRRFVSCVDEGLMICCPDEGMRGRGGGETVVAAARSMVLPWLPELMQAMRWNVILLLGGCSCEPQ